MLFPLEDGEVNAELEVSQEGGADAELEVPQEGEENAVPNELEFLVDNNEEVSDLHDLEIPADDGGENVIPLDSEEHDHGDETQPGASSRPVEPLYVKVGSHDPHQPYGRDSVQYSQLVASPYYNGDEDLDAGSYILISVAVPDLCECRKRLDELYLMWYDRMSRLLASLR